MCVCVCVYNMCVCACTYAYIQFIWPIDEALTVITMGDSGPSSNGNEVVLQNWMLFSVIPGHCNVFALFSDILTFVGYLIAKAILVEQYWYY